MPADQASTRSLAGCDALVVGGGLAGASLAILLARAGRSVTLLEQHAGPHHKVCGEFLSYEALGYLEQAGISPVALGAVAITHVRYCLGAASVSRPLPFPAMSLTRRTLDEVLLAAATASGVTLLRQRVESLVRSGEQWLAQTSSGETLNAPAAFLATGKHDLRGYTRPSGRQNSLVGLKMYLRLAAQQHAELDRHVELLTFPAGYAGLQPVEGGCANLCALIRGDTYRRIGGDWASLLEHMMSANPLLRRRLAGASPQLERPLAIARIPYGFVRQHTPDPALWCLGDQAAVIPSFSGDGMSIALHTGASAAAAFLKGDTAAEWQSGLHRELHRQVGRATALSQLLVSRPGRQLASAAVRLFPGLLPNIARATRIRPEALLPSAQV